MTIAPSHVREILADAVIEDPEAGLYRANRRIFIDEEIFELEMAHIFEGNWIYLATRASCRIPAITSPPTSAASQS